MAATGVLTMSASAVQTTALLVTDADYTNALSIADNNILGTTAAIDFTNFDVATTGNITVVAGQGIDAATAGILALGNVNAATINMGAAASTLTIGGAAASTINLGDIAVSGTIDIGGVTADATSTINIATNATNGDTITIGNTNATTTTAIKGGNKWNINVTGNITASFTSSSSFALCHVTNGPVDNDLITDCSGAPAADYAERYPVAQGVTFGDIVVPGTHMVTTQDENHGAQQIAQAVLSSEAYQGPVYGIVSNNYGDFTSAGNNVPESENPMPVALVGRVPVKVASDSEVIRIGDFLTTSGTQPGKAMKATQAGRVVGMAMANWDGSSATIMVQVINTWYQPATSLQGGSSAVLATTSSDISGVNGAFSGTVTVAEHLYGSQDMAGRVRLVSGKSKVHVKFKKAYASGGTPIVTLASRSSGASAWVSNEDSSGFDVNRSDDSSQVEFNWIAIGVNDALVTVSNGQDDVTISVNDTDGPDAPAPVVVAPAPEVVVTPAREEVTPAADPVPEASAPAMEPAPEVSAPAADPAPAVVTE